LLEATEVAAIVFGVVLTVLIAIVPTVVDR
jgi:hypothetical protein